MDWFRKIVRLIPNVCNNINSMHDYSSYMFDNLNYLLEYLIRYSKEVWIEYIGTQHYDNSLCHNVSLILVVCIQDEESANLSTKQW